jgi:hypothetical protein
MIALPPTTEQLKTEANMIAAAGLTKKVVAIVDNRKETSLLAILRSNYTALTQVVQHGDLVPVIVKLTIGT